VKVHDLEHFHDILRLRARQARSRRWDNAAHRLEAAGLR
jgi:hypothetical protein